VAGSIARVAGRSLAGVVIGLVILVVAAILFLRWQEQQAEQEVRDDQAEQAEIIREDLERLRDDGPFEEPEVDDLVYSVQGSLLVSMTERADDVRVIVRVAGFGPPASIMSPSYACHGFTVPLSSAPVTVERLSPEKGHGLPEECISR
jgi:type II secretory pathway pseudopilin PulG